MSTLGFMSHIRQGSQGADNMSLEQAKAVEMLRQLQKYVEEMPMPLQAVVHLPKLDSLTPPLGPYMGFKHEVIISQDESSVSNS